MADCLDENTINAFASGRLVAGQLQAAEAHIDSCADCRQLLALARQSSSLSTGATLPSGPSGSVSSGLRRVGRYELLEELGHGAMGVVFAARDPQLDRVVALKVVRALSATSEQRELLLREAQTMARLAHPNVAQIYDAGDHEDGVFLAIELLRGGTLRSWLSTRPPWRAVVRKFIEAGRGLAAAHAAGVVHRDFKPDNVMLGADGVARVTDFGLARVAAGGLASAAHLTSSTLAGTPVYMSPEQFAGQIDATSDQFSFCVALFEGLYGVRPFAGSSLRELRERVSSGKVQVPPSSAVPAWVSAVLLRGLSVDRAARFPSMDALVAALDQDPEGRKRRIRLGVAAALTVAVVAAGVSITAQRRLQSCQGSESKLAGVWDSEKKKTIEAAFLATKVPFAPRAWEQVRTRLDAASAAFVVARTEACEATAVLREQSAEALDLRMACLDRWVSDVRLATDVLATADAQVVSRAAQVATPPPLAPCADLQALRSPVRPPSPEARAQVDLIVEQISRARVLGRAAKLAAADTLATEALTAARGVAHPPTLAAALELSGRLKVFMGKGAEGEGLLVDSVASALEGRDELAAARAATMLVFAVGYTGGRYEEGLRWSKLARATLRSSDAELEARLENSIGSVLLAMDHYDDAISHFDRAVTLWEQALGPDHPDLASGLMNMGNALGARGRTEDALGRHQRALEIALRGLGPDHPTTAAARTNTGADLMVLGRFDEAVELSRAALAAQEKSLGLEHPELANTLVTLADTLRLQGKRTEAMQHLERAVAIRKKALGATNPEVARALLSLSELLLAEKRPNDAMTALKEAHGILETSAPESAYMALVLGAMGDCLRELGDAKGAVEHHERALVLQTKLKGPKHVETGVSLANLGIALLSAKAAPRAVEKLEQALEILEAAKANPVSLAGTRFALAQAMWTANVNRPGAVKLAGVALETWSKVPGREASAAEVRAWIDKPSAPTK